MVKKKTSRKKAKKSTGKKNVSKASTLPKIKAQAYTKVTPTKTQSKAQKKAKKTSTTTRGKKQTTRTSSHAGRPSILTQDLIDKVTALIMAGAYIETACAAVGFHKGLYYEWLKLGAKRRDLERELEFTIKGERRDQVKKDLSMIAPIYQQFNDAVQKAVIDGELRDITRIDQAAARSWQAAAWKLERKHPQRWARQQKIEHAGKVETGADIDKTRSVILDIMKDPKALELAEQLIDRIT